MEELGGTESIESDPIDVVGRRINKKGPYIKACRMFLDVLGIQYGGAAAIELNA